MSGCDCAQAQSAIEEYLRSECSAEQREEIRAHLAECPDCTHELEVTEQLVTVVRRACGENAPDDVRAKVLDAIKRTPCGGRQAAAAD